ncbi:hypothetical protein ABW19_dt0209001 [Dactylella cylindrospora]|nr:hypothetical protein ABW19_dt0209001 [Dactylella cylindrospora]
MQSFRIWIIATYGRDAKKRTEEAFLEEIAEPLVREATWTRNTISRRKRRYWKALLDDLILSLSDQQIITGIAVTLAGATQLNNGISFYHWNVLVYLAWFSSLTHLSALTILRWYLRSYKSVRILRVAFLVCFAVLLLGVMHPLFFTGATLDVEEDSPIMANWAAPPDGNSSDSVGTYSEGYRAWYNFSQGSGVLPLSFPTKCLYQRHELSVNLFTDNGAMLSVFILGISYLTRMVKLFAPSSAFAGTILRDWPKECGRSVLRRMHGVLQGLPAAGYGRFTRIALGTIYFAMCIVAIFVAVFYRLIESLLWELLWLIFACAWVFANLDRIRRKYKYDFPAQYERELQWTFGQWLACLLLVLPFLALLSTYQKYKKDSKTIGEKNKLNSDLESENLQLEEVYSEEPTPTTSSDPAGDSSLLSRDPIPSPDQTLYHSPSVRIQDEEALEGHDSEHKPQEKSEERRRYRCLDFLRIDFTKRDARLSEKSQPKCQTEHWIYEENQNLFKFFWFRHLTGFALLWSTMTGIYFIVFIIAFNDIISRSVLSLVLYFTVLPLVWIPMILYAAACIAYQNQIEKIRKTLQVPKFMMILRKLAFFEATLPFLMTIWMILYNAPGMRGYIIYASIDLLGQWSYYLHYPLQDALPIQFSLLDKPGF